MPSGAKKRKAAKKKKEIESTTFSNNPQQQQGSLSCIFLSFSADLFFIVDSKLDAQFYFSSFCFFN